MKTKFLRLPAIFTAATSAFLGAASAGTFNVDFQSDFSGDLMFGPGIIGSGSFWNEAFTAPLTTVKRDDATVIPGVEVELTGPGLFATSTAGGNDVQRDGVITHPGGPMMLTVRNLRPNSCVTVLIYTRAFFGNFITAINSGETQLIRTPGLPEDLQDAVEGQDYARFDGLLTDANGTLTFSITDRDDPTNGSSTIRGLQVRGWLPGEVFPGKADLKISKKAASGFRGDNRYGGGQTLTITRKRKGKFFQCLENDAGICLAYRLQSKRSDAKAARKWFDLSNGRTNITAAVAVGQYQKTLDPGVSILIQHILRAKDRDARRAVSVLKAYAVENASLTAHGDKTKSIVKP